MLAVLAGSLAAACRYSPDPGGARFACDSLTPCPDGVTCIDGYCQAASEPVDAADSGGEPDAGGEVNAPLAWKAHAAGKVDNGLLDSVDTAEPLSGQPDDLYLAFISTKPARVIESVTGLGLDWHALRQQCSGRSTASLALYWARSPDAAQPGKVIATMTLDPAQGSALLSVHRYAGADPANPIGNLSYANSNGSDDEAGCDGGIDSLSYSWSTIDTGAPGSFVVSGAHTSNYDSHIAGDAFTERSDEQSGSTSLSAGVAVQDRKVLAAQNDVRVNGSWLDAPDWAVIAVELRD